MSIHQHSGALNGPAIILATVTLVTLALPHPAQAQGAQTAQGPAARGQETFQSLCAACHTIGQGVRLGPDLQGVTERRDEAWIIDFVQGSQDVIASGDSVATRLFREYDQLVMPDQPLTDDDVRAVLAYIRQAGSTGASTAVEEGPAPEEEISEEQIQRGRALFQGMERFANGGPSCNSCHDVALPSVVAGGSLAVDLTSAFSRLGGQAGVRAVVGNPPFPVMARAYEQRPLTDTEVTAVTGFLQRTDEDGGTSRSVRYASMLLASGIGGTGLLLLVSTTLWSGRRKKSVNAEIYERQTNAG